MTEDNEPPLQESFTIHLGEELFMLISNPQGILFNYNCVCRRVCMCMYAIKVASVILIKMFEGKKNIVFKIV